MGVVVAGSLATLGKAKPVPTVAAAASDASRRIRMRCCTVMMRSLEFLLLGLMAKSEL
jgi:hypothetical protein